MVLRIVSNIDDAARYFRDMAANQRETVISRSVNKVAGTARTVAIKEVTKAGGFKTQAYVRQRTTLRRGSAASPTASITMRSKWSTLMAHRPTPKFKSGGALRRARPWGEARRYYKAFYIQGQNGNQLPVTRTGKGRRAYKVIYGANPARELERDDARVPVERHIAEKLPAEVVRYARVYSDQLKIRYKL